MRVPVTIPIETYEYYKDRVEYHDGILYWTKVSKFHPHLLGKAVGSIDKAQAALEHAHKGE